jgi:hypothetical protein
MVMGGLQSPKAGKDKKNSKRSGSDEKDPAFN